MRILNVLRLVQSQHGEILLSILSQITQVSQPSTQTMLVPAPFDDEAALRSFDAKVASDVAALLVRAFPSGMDFLYNCL